MPVSKAEFAQSVIEFSRSKAGIGHQKPGSESGDVKQNTRLEASIAEGRFIFDQMQNLLMRFSPYIANDNMTPISAPIRDIIAQGDWRSVWDKITSIEDRDAYALVRWASLLMISEFVEIEPSTQLSTQTVSA